MKTRKFTMHFLLGIVLLLSGCVSVGNEVRILPASDIKWKYASENYLRDDMVEYDCSKFKIRVWEVPVRSKIYFAGLIIPIIPIFYGIDEPKDNPNLKVEIGTTNGTEITEDLSSIVISDKANKPHAGTGYKTYGTGIGTMLYRVDFDFRRDSITEFELSFSKPINSCIVTPVYFKRSDITGLRLWTPGP